MRTLLPVGAVVCACLSVTAGCRLLNDDAAVVQTNSPLRPAQSSPDSVKMEIIWARFPADQSDLLGEAWAEIDETRIDPAVRRGLAGNGLRAGIISGKLPEAIAQALHRGEAGSSPSMEISGESTELSADAAVHGRVRQLQRGQRMEIQASEIYPSLPLLISGGQELSGRTYQQAQAIYALQIDPRPDSTTLVELTPELHHGPPRMQWTTGEGALSGVLHQAPLRDREVFQQMRLHVPLTPGEILVLMSLPDCSSRLGHYFHTSQSGKGPQHKLILIRVAEMPENNTFASAS